MFTESTPPATNVAVTDRAAFIETVHVPVPVQAPDHPLNAVVDDGVAVRVTEPDAAKVCVQGVSFVGPVQLIPIGLELTEPSPLTFTVRSFSVANVAVTSLDSVINK